MKSPRKTAAARPPKVSYASASQADTSSAAALAKIYLHADAALFSISVGPRQVFRLQNASLRFLELTGLKKNVIGRPLVELLPQPGLDRVVRHCRKAIRTRKTIRWDDISTLKSGTRHGQVSLTPVADVSGRVTHLSGFVHDITEHRKAEQALLQSAERFRRIVETALEGVWTIDARSLTDYVNPKMAQMMGYKAEEMLGRPISDFLDDEGRALLNAHIKNRKNGISDHFEFKYVRKDGSPLWAFVSTNPIYNSAGEYVGAMALLTDISTRRAAEAAMQESDAQFRAIFEQAAVGVALVDSSSGRFLSVNQRACEISRLTRSQLLSSSFKAVAHPEDLKKLQEMMQKLRSGLIPTCTMEIRCLHAAGSTTWVSLTISPMWKKGEPPSRCVAIMQDITARKEAESSLARTTELLERTGEMARIGGWELDVATRRLFWSLETCRLFEIGTTQAPSVEKAIDFYTPEARPIIREAVQKAIDHGTAYDVELPVITAKGRLFWARSQGSAIRKNGRTVQLIGTFQDITTHRQAEQALIESEVRFRTIFEQAVVGVGLVDLATGRFIDVNLRYATIVGRSRREMLRLSAEELTHAEDRPRHRRMYQQLKSGAIPEFHLEQRCLRQDGSLVWVNLNASLLSPLTGRADQMLVMVEDITSRKLAEENYRREQGFNEILASHTSAIIILMDRRGHIMHANDAALQLTGFSRKEIVGKPPPWDHPFMEKAEKDWAKKSITDMLAGKNMDTREVSIFSKDGRRHIVALSSIITKTPDGGVDRIIITGTDLTERNRLQKEILKISEQEQARIGHNLHDGIGQTMTGISSLIEALAGELTGSQRESAARIYQLMQQAIQEVRHMSHSLSPASVKNRGLGGALHLLAETIRTNHRTSCTCEVDPDIKVEDPEKETHIYRIAQEAANNALRHGRPSSIRISLQRKGEENAVLKIEDNGRGLSKRAASHPGIGMRVMDYRANLIEGSLIVKKGARRGVSVICRFPYSP
ncbi:PAS domain S-box protein [Prosthecobacter vanneervenii]|uniref:PAS domain S-box-containing protein n=1 Tax=Prosthecobacter vanneervenii TaxID=48466 RepID=A0A7W7Y7T4_9BACT|nr:PAS domain S-box protein [Prosthecobacter vanneervenii]MBB5031017.1 PAS domain S-box-containing protein [Prosthecobacter vanneervenii]